MGQQQLLLIVLGVIIVGIAVVVGITTFAASSTSSNRDAVVSDLTHLATVAQAYYQTPIALAGGGNTFTGWSVPATLASTAHGTYTATIAAQSVTLVGTGTQTGDDGTNPVKVTLVISPTSITSTTSNN
jgi:Tfp pilus assembly protein PilE